MLYIVDGTADTANDEIYLTVMANSFCRRMSKRFNGHYFRGPTTRNWTISTESIADAVYAGISNRSPLLGREPLFLAGHSRGGAAVIRVAQDLKKSGHAVDAMFLFDAVDRTGPFTRSVQHIPANVRVAYHARRHTTIAVDFEPGRREAENQYYRCIAGLGSDRATQICEKERLLAIKYRRLDDAMKVRTRASFGDSLDDGMTIPFGNCGIGPEDKKMTRYEQVDFPGSHGALGGSPIGEQDNNWLSVADGEGFQRIRNQDRMAMAMVWTWMSDNFDKQKLQLHAGVRSEIRK